MGGKTKTNKAYINDKINNNEEMNEQMNGIVCMSQSL